MEVCPTRAQVHTLKNDDCSTATFSFTYGWLSVVGLSVTMWSLYHEPQATGMAGADVVVDFGLQQPDP